MKTEQETDEDLNSYLMANHTRECDIIKGNLKHQDAEDVLKPGIVLCLHETNGHSLIMSYYFQIFSVMASTTNFATKSFCLQVRSTWIEIG